MMSMRKDVRGVAPAPSQVASASPSTQRCDVPSLCCVAFAVGVRLVVRACFRLAMFRRGRRNQPARAQVLVCPAWA